MNKSGVWSQSSGRSSGWVTERRLRNLLGAPPGECGARRPGAECAAPPLPGSWGGSARAACCCHPCRAPATRVLLVRCAKSPRRAHRGRACLTARPTAGCRDKGSPAPGHRGRAGPPAPGPGLHAAAQRALTWPEWDEGRRRGGHPAGGGRAWTRSSGPRTGRGTRCTELRPHELRDARAPAKPLRGHE